MQPLQTLQLVEEYREMIERGGANTSSIVYRQKTSHIKRYSTVSTEGQTATPIETVLTL